MADAVLVAGLIVAIAILLVIAAFLRWMFKAKHQSETRDDERGHTPR